MAYRRRLPEPIRIRLVALALLTIAVLVLDPLKYGVDPLIFLVSFWTSIAFLWSERSCIFGRPVGDYVQLGLFAPSVFFMYLAFYRVGMGIVLAVYAFKVIISILAGVIAGVGINIYEVIRHPRCRAWGPRQNY